MWAASPVPHPDNATNAMLYDVEALAENDVWAVGRYNQLVVPPFNSDQFTLALHWDGEAWTQIPTPSPTLQIGMTWCDLQAVAAIDSDDIWAAGQQNSQGADGFVGMHMLLLHWNGVEWSIVPGPAPVGGSGDQVLDIEVVAPDHVWFFGTWIVPPDGGGAFQRPLAMVWDGSDFHITETEALNINGATFEAGSALGPDEVWAVGGAGDNDYASLSYIYRWNGFEWVHMPGPAPGNEHRLYDVEAIATDDVWAVGEYIDAQGYHAMALHWDGDSWTLYELPTGSRALYAFATDDVYAAGDGIMHWDGSAWSVAAGLDTLDGTVAPAAFALEALGPCQLWGVGRDLTQDLQELRGFAVRSIPADDVPGDLDGDGDVDQADLGILLSCYGTGDCGDLDGDGDTDQADLGALLANYGTGA